MLTVDNDVLTSTLIILANEASSVTASVSNDRHLNLEVIPQVFTIPAAILVACFKSPVSEKERRKMRCRPKGQFIFHYFISNKDSVWVYTCLFCWAKQEFSSYTNKTLFNCSHVHIQDAFTFGSGRDQRISVNEFFGNPSSQQAIHGGHELTFGIRI